MTNRPQRVAYHFDIMCPFAFRGAQWIREVRTQTGLQIDWRFFSLEEINRREGKKHPWEREWSYGWSLLRIAAYLRREDMGLCDAWYDKAGTALHIEGRKPHRPEVARALLAEIGVDPAVVDRAIADPSTHDEVRADHDAVVNSGGFGVPTLFFEDGQALYGPVLVHPPTGDRAVALWDTFTAVLDFPEVYEIHRPRGPVQQQEIFDALETYLSARDWISIDRGEVLTFDAPVPATQGS
ncbi:MAG TPA: DsbA family protein [Sporichthyaceae bacterium]